MVEFCVLRCAECQTFQVLQVTKTAKWKCKMCDQKQSVMKVYGQGSGADCRRHVQKLNSLQCRAAWEVEEKHLVSASQISLSHSGVRRPENICPIPETSLTTTQSSRWSSFIDESIDEVDGSLMADDEDNDNRSKITTRIEYQENKTAWKKRNTTETSNEFSAPAEQKSRKICPEENIIYQNQTHCRPGYHYSNSQNWDNKTDQSHQINYTLNENHSKSDTSLKSASDKVSYDIFKPKVHNDNKYNQSASFLSSAVACNKDENLSHLKSSRLIKDCTIDENTHALSVRVKDHGCVDKALINDVSHRCMKESSESSAQNEMHHKQKLVSETSVASKWNVFLDNDVHDESDDDDDMFAAVADSNFLEGSKQAGLSLNYFKPH